MRTSSFACTVGLNRPMAGWSRACARATSRGGDAIKRPRGPDKGARRPAILQIPRGKEARMDPFS